MRLNEEQTQEIATRLGITAPEQPKEVAEFLARWDTYKESVSEFQSPRLSSWGKFEMIESNARAIATARKQFDSIEAQGKYLENMGAVIRLAVTAYQEAQNEFERKIEAESERPRREFDGARNAFTQALEKEARSLKYRTSRSKHWQLPADSPEAIEYNEWSDRSNLIAYLLQEARYVEATPEAPIFTEQAILDRVLENEYRVTQVLELLAKCASKGE